MQISLKEILLLVMLVAGYFPFADGYRAARLAYLESKCAPYLAYEKLANARNGDELTEIQNYFEALDPVATQAAIRATGDTAIQPNDQFFAYPVSSDGFQFLQFRDGRLLNYQSRNAKYSRWIAANRKLETPPWILSIGHWPIYLALVGMVTAFMIYHRIRLTRTTSANAEQIRI